MPLKFWVLAKSLEFTGVLGSGLCRRLILGFWEEFGVFWVFGGSEDQFFRGFEMRWSRQQQIWLGLLSIVPGVLSYYKVIRPVYAALVLVGLYFLSKRHAFLVQRQFEREDFEKREKEALEKQKLAGMSMKKRRSIEKAKMRKEADAQTSEDGNSAEEKETTKITEDYQGRLTDLD